MTSTVTAPPQAPTAAPAASGEKPKPTFAQKLSKFDLKASPYFYIAPFFLLFGLTGLFPLIYTAVVSVFDWKLLGGQGDFVGLGNFIEVLSAPFFWNSLFNTISIFLLSSIPQLAIALVVAYLLDQGLRAPTFWRMSILIPFVVTPVAVAIIFSSIFNPGDGLANNLLGVIGIENIDWKRDTFFSHLAIAIMVNFRWTGYNALILLAAMQAVPRELYESAAIDGAGSPRRFFSITLPTIRPTLIFVIITATIGGLQIFAEPRLLDPASNGGIGGADRQFQTTVLYMWELGFQSGDLGRASAVAWLLFLLIIVFGLINFFLSNRIAAAGDPKKPNRKTRRAMKEAAQ
ncbi:carbohydrate ABC transporter permease [Microbacterium phosphatis]|uniref:carbohydrate ABC transporter permease n=1 Tax=Microbacterium phosphatis TaxID=3140248 RepID=UPI0031405C18